MRRRNFIKGIVGSAVAWPRATRAQQGGRIPRVGFLWHAGSREEESPNFEAVIEGFAKLGYVDGRNIILEHRFPNEKPERFRAMAAELVALNVDVLMVTAAGTPYVRDATTKIPVVFMGVPDPVGTRLVQTFARPGGNMTGLTNFGEELAAKRLQLLKELVPGLSRVGLLVTRDLPSKGSYIEGSRAAADKLGLVIQVFELTSMEDMEPAFDAMVSTGMQAVTLAQGGFVFQGRATVAKLALARRLALCAYSKQTFEAGALMAYGPNILDSFRRMATYVDKILKGAKPSELPVEQPTKFEFFVNLTVAKKLGLDVPPHLQQIADEVIE
jgi:putative tryptophan/tyrosine transport system substrate-binding protein